MKFSRRLVLAAMGVGLAIAAVLVAVLLFDATEPEGVPAPDRAPSVGVGDQGPLQ